MDATETVEYVRRLSSFEVTLETGKRYTLVLPMIERLMSFGSVPLPILNAAGKAEGNGKAEGLTEESLETARSMIEFYDLLLAEGIVGIDGEPVSMTVEAVKYIPPDEREELLEYLKREKDPTPASP